MRLKALFEYAGLLTILRNHASVHYFAAAGASIALLGHVLFGFFGSRQAAGGPQLEETNTQFLHPRSLLGDGGMDPVL